MSTSDTVASSQVQEISANNLIIDLSEAANVYHSIDDRNGK